MTHVPYGPQSPGQLTYNRGTDGAVIAPTIFSPPTTPELSEWPFLASQQLAEYTIDQLVLVATGMVGDMIVRGVVRRLARPGGGRGCSTICTSFEAGNKSRELSTLDTTVRGAVNRQYG